MITTERETTENAFPMILGGLLLGVIGVALMHFYERSMDGYVIVRPGFSAFSLIFWAGLALAFIGFGGVLAAFGEVSRTAPWTLTIGAVALIAALVVANQNGYLPAGSPGSVERTISMVSFGLPGAAALIGGARLVNRFRKKTLGSS